MAIFSNKNRQSPELGFGKKNYNGNIRFINKDGSLNIRRRGLTGIQNLDVYHWLITTSIKNLMVLIVSGYTLINLAFACLYYVIGPAQFGGLLGNTSMDQFLGLFFFSAQTLTTVGYGHVYPISHLASTVAAIESMFGLLGFALVTGVVYGRFSRPKADLLFSKNILISPYGKIKGLMFRIANKKQYELIESEANVTVSYNDPETGKREYDQLKLEIEKINFLSLSWTIVHPLDEHSPLMDWTLNDFRTRDIEILILLKAINDTHSQTVYSRFSYKADDIIDGAKFKQLKQERTSNDAIQINVNEIHEYNKFDQ